MDVTTAYLFKMPLAMREALERYAGERNLTTSYVIREAIAAHIGLPSELVYRNGKQKYEDTSLTAKRQRENEKRKQARQMLTKLAKENPEMLERLSRNE